MAEADTAMDSMIEAMKAAVDRIALPDKIARTFDYGKTVADVREICRNRMNTFA